MIRLMNYLDGFRFYRGEEGAQGEGTIPIDTQCEFAGIQPGSVSWGNGRFLRGNTLPFSVPQSRECILSREHEP